MLPPMVTYKANKEVLYQSWTGGPEGTPEAGCLCSYACNKSGGFNMARFNQWFKEAWLY